MKHKARLASLLVLALLAAVPHLRAADLSAIKSRGVLRVLVILDDEIEFFSGKPGPNPGFDHELLEVFAHLHGLKLDLVPSNSWEGLIPALLQDKGDVIAGRFTITESRKETIDFTSEVFPIRNVVVTRKPHRVVKTLEELQQERISVIKGTSMVDLLLKQGVRPENVDYSIPTGKMQEALRSGRATCTVHESYTAIMAQRQDPAIQIGLFIGPPMSLGYGVRKNEPELLGALNQCIQNVRRSGAWNRLAVKYFGRAALDILQKARAE